MSNNKYSIFESDDAGNCIVPVAKNFPRKKDADATVRFLQRLRPKSQFEIRKSIDYRPFMDLTVEQMDELMRNAP